MGSSARPYTNNLHLAPDITTPTSHHSIFTGQLLFQPMATRQSSTEGNTENTSIIKDEARQQYKLYSV